MPHKLTPTNTPTSLILAVEDSDEDFEAMTRAFNRAGMQNTILRRDNGEAALAYLDAAAAGTEPMPCIILMDLNLPGIDGRQALRNIKQSTTLRMVPVIVLTTSDDERDVDECYRLGANSYILKPVDFEGFIRAVQKLRQYWFEIVLMPRSEASKQTTAA